MTDYSQIKSNLEAMLADLTSRVERIDVDLSAPGDQDWEERAVEREGNEVLSKLGNLSLQEIDQIKHALQQIEAGHYGQCESCGGRIQLERLEALPFATTCAACA